ncbi:MAG: hypothetical protein AVDCRST_MAG77-1501 [uncultured Chloroflexi bacterium]|uniref:Uncharacterized protein n=1 Tax=uncultured Chloroflexota bacterium TaxID=166587 RepID=A0A6J4HY39_9CHLR|nr:MAG: hypothetical protein AVDCRST_MAG77-1501 [uncultured Chloroflexota bacterium]
MRSAMFPLWLAAAGLCSGIVLLITANSIQLPPLAMAGVCLAVTSAVPLVAGVSRLTEQAGSED